MTACDGSCSHDNDSFSPDSFWGHGGHSLSFAGLLEPPPDLIRSDYYDELGLGI